MPMYLLQVDGNGELIHDEFLGRNIPPYAILSHTWSENHKDEVSFKDIAKGRGKAKQGYSKLRFCAKQALADNLKYFWVDTCCIDKSSSAELQEAINSMFSWYQKSAKCYVYLADVTCLAVTDPPNGHVGEPISQQLWISAFQQSRWFTRGWTLQELLAPATVEFFSAEGSKLGDKQSLADEIHKITGIPRNAFPGTASSMARFSVEERISWSDHRTTTRNEDRAYSLLGLFDLHIALLYGEGEDNAFRRLHEERKRQERHKKRQVAPRLRLPVAAAESLSGSERQSPVEVEDSQTLKRGNEDAFSPVQASERNFKVPRRDPAQPDPAQSTSPGAETYVDTAHSERHPPDHEKSEAQTTSAQASIVSSVPVKARPMNDAAAVHGLVLADEDLNTLSGRSFEHKDEEAKAQADNMQMWWNEAIEETKYLPQGYAQVSVLLLKWADDFDELVTRNEITMAENCFREHFNYHVETLELSLKHKPSLQLRSGVNRFIETHDGPNNLLIVYYIGQGTFNERYHSLELVASTQPWKWEDAHARWSSVEDILRSDDTEADVLTILDCAGSHDTDSPIEPQKPFTDRDNESRTSRHGGADIRDHTVTQGGNAASKKFELITTPISDKSVSVSAVTLFTRSLLDSMIQLSKGYGGQSFSTWHLTQRVCNDPRRSDVPVSLWSRLPNERHISLAPIPVVTKKRRATVRAPRGYLNLRIGLRYEHLAEMQIRSLAQGLSNLARQRESIGVRKIDWLGITPVQTSSFDRVALAMYAVSQWKILVRKKRRQRLAQAGNETPGKTV